MKAVCVLVVLGVMLLCSSVSAQFGMILNDCQYVEDPNPLPGFSKVIGDKSMLGFVYRTGTIMPDKRYTCKGLTRIISRNSYRGFVVNFDKTKVSPVVITDRSKHLSSDESVFDMLRTSCLSQFLYLDASDKPNYDTAKADKYIAPTDSRRLIITPESPLKRSNFFQKKFKSLFVGCPDGSFSDAALSSRFFVNMGVNPTLVYKDDDAWLFSKPPQNVKEVAFQDLLLLEVKEGTQLETKDNSHCVFYVARQFGDNNRLYTLSAVSNDAQGGRQATLTRSTLIASYRLFGNRFWDPNTYTNKVKTYNAKIDFLSLTGVYDTRTISICSEDSAIYEMLYARGGFLRLAA